MEIILLLCPFLSFIAIALLIILTVFTYGIWSKKAQETSWRELASRTGLSFERGGAITRPILSGIYQNRRVKVDVHSHSTGYKPGSSSYPYTRIQLEVQNQDNSSLAIKEKHHMPLFSKAGVPVGDPAVDARFSIQSSPNDLGNQLFRATNLHQSILSARSFDLELTGVELCLEERGIDKDVDYMIWLLQLLYGVADFIENQ